MSRRLERHPTIDYADCVTYNWERIDKQGPMTPENVRILNRFTGLLDEEWSQTTHLKPNPHPHPHPHPTP